jgi:hypothetical protein
MGAEGVIALAAGIAAASIALISFGLDSFIEGFASLAIVWRFTGSRLHSHAAEQRAQKLVAIPVLPAGPVRGLRGAAHALDGGRAVDELARHRARHVVPHRNARTRDRQAPACRPAGLGRDPRRGDAEPPLRVPGGGRARRPTRERASSASGGSTRSPPSSSPASRLGKGSRAGAARAAAPPAREGMNTASTAIAAPDEAAAEL